MRNLNAIAASIRQQWRVFSWSADFLGVLFQVLPLLALLAWITRDSDNPVALTNVMVGAGLVALWYATLQRMGWLVAREMSNGTLELSVISRTPLMLIFLGRAVGLVSINIITAGIALVTVIAVSQRLVQVEDVVPFVISILMAVLALFSCAFIFSPLYFVTRGQPGFFNGIRPLVVLLSGLVHPISALPVGLELLGRLLPISWAMESLVRSVEGDSSLWVIAGDWAVALLLTMLYLGLAVFLFRRIERRVRVQATLASF